MTQIWAHAGAAAHAPANTMVAFELAVEQRADGVELDVHLTRDRHLVCHHDETVVMPDGGRVLIRNATLADLAAADVGDDTVGRAAIPTLPEVYELLAPTGLLLNVEVKNGPVLYPGIEQELLRAQRASGMSERVVYSSFNHFTLMTLQDLEPGAEVAPLYTTGLVDPWIYLRHLGLSTVHPFYLNLTVPGILDGFRDAGIAVRAWTVNDPADWLWLVDAGIDAIITDAPGAAVRARDAMARAVSPDQGTPVHGGERTTAGRG